MKQALHIFRKDLFHLWPELGVYGFLLVAFSLEAPPNWPGVQSSNPITSTLVTLLKVLIPLSSLVIITRVVHEESLVGQDQFWITRPYRWGSLLVSKCTFIVLMLMLPLAMMQWSLVFQASLNPFTAFAGMTSCLAKFSVVWFLFLLVATFTSTLSSAFMTVAGIAVLWAGILQFLSPDSGTRMSPPGVLGWAAVVFAALLIATLVYQYRHRRPMVARVAFGAILTLFVLLNGVFWSAHSESVIRVMVRSLYSAPSDSALRLSFVPNSVPYEDQKEDDGIPPGYIELKMPIGIVGLQKDVRVNDANITFVLDGPHVHYESPWEPATMNDTNIAFLIQQKVYEASLPGQVKMDVQLIGETLRPGGSETVSIEKSFPSPDHGRCILDRGTVTCRYAYETPGAKLVKGFPVSGSCGVVPGTNAAYARFRAFPTGTVLDPVKQQALSFEGRMCPGTPLTFLEFYPGTRFRLALNLPNVSLAAYQTR